MKRQGEDLEQALLALNDLGYTVDAFILNASHWTPQSRARLFIVAEKGDSKRADALAPAVHKARPEALSKFIFLNPHIDWNIRQLPPLPERTIRLPDIIEDLTNDDPQWWNEERTEYIMGQLSDRHQAVADDLIGRPNYSYATAFRRVRKGRSMAEIRTDGLAGCLRTPRGGSGRQILFRFGKGTYRVRLLNARECARLQGVPEDYQINVPLNQSLFGFGDAVCVPAVRWIADNYLSPLMDSR